MSSTYKDIKHITGYSLGTISRYFNGGNLRAKTKKDIQAAVTQLDFRVNGFARGLKSRKSLTIGLLIPELNSVFNTTIMRHVGQFFRRRGYSCLVCDCDYEIDTEREALSFLIDKMVDGIIAIPTDVSGKSLSLAHAHDVPLVLVDRKTEEFETDTVLIDNYAAGRTAADYLMARGHYRAAVIAGPISVYTMKQRSNGFLDAFTIHNNGRSPAADSVFVTETDFSIEGGYKAAKELLESKNCITAIFCVNYELTLGTIIAMNELGVKYPDDISFFGFDNMELTRTVNPSLTLVEQPLELLAQSASQLLLARLENNDNSDYKTIILDTKLVEGDSISNLNIQAPTWKGLRRA